VGVGVCVCVWGCVCGREREGVRGGEGGGVVGVYIYHAIRGLFTPSPRNGIFVTLLLLLLLLLLWQLTCPTTATTKHKYHGRPCTALICSPVAVYYTYICEPSNDADCRSYLDLCYVRTFVTPSATRTE